MKATLRKRILAQRAGMTSEEWRDKSDAIRRNILESSAYKEAKRIFVFVSMRGEVDTISLIEQAWRDGKQVCVPIAKKGEAMYFVLLENMAELARTSFGVLEPKKDRTQAVVPKGADMILVPGSVFDSSGNRYGYGGGFYDRYFETYPDSMKIAIAFSFQLMAEPLAVDQYDVPMDWIVTENGWNGGNYNESID